MFIGLFVLPLFCLCMWLAYENWKLRERIDVLNCSNSNWQEACNQRWGTIYELDKCKAEGLKAWNKEVTELNHQISVLVDLKKSFESKYEEEKKISKSLGKIVEEESQHKAFYMSQLSKIESILNEEEETMDVQL